MSSKAGSSSWVLRQGADETPSHLTSPTRHDKHLTVGTHSTFSPKKGQHDAGFSKQSARPPTGESLQQKQSPCATPLPPTTTTKQVKIDHPAAADNVDSSTVTVEIVVASEADGYAVLTYVLSVAEGSSISSSSTGAGGGSGRGLSSALNEALQGRTTENCLCVAVPLPDGGGGGGGFDCSACEEGGEFSTVRSTTTSQGRYDLFSTERGSGRSPVSVFDSADSRGDDDMFWGDFAGGRAIRGIIRSESYFDMAGVVVAVVCFTSLGLLLLRRTTLGGRGSSGDLSSSLRGGKAGLLAADTTGVAGRKQQRSSRKSSAFKRGDSPRSFTPEATPAP